MMLVTIRGRLRDDPEAIRQIHDGVTAATKEMALQAGDISHRVCLNAQDGWDFLGIDEWKSAEAVRPFSANPQIQEFFAQMFEGAPEVTSGREPAGTSGEPARASVCRRVADTSAMSLSARQPSLSVGPPASRRGLRSGSVTIERERRSGGT